MDDTIFQEIKKEYAEKRSRAHRAADIRREEIYTAIPEVKTYDRQMLILSHSLVGSGEDAVSILAEIEFYAKKREEALIAAGYPKDYTNPPYECPFCSDTGYKGIEMCDCMKKRIRLESLKTSGLGKLAQNQSFNNFSFNYYNGADRERAIQAFSSLKDFATSFDGTEPDSFLLVGGTGLGKTHLSTSVAKAVIERGFDVVYTTSIRMFDAFEKKRFSQDSRNKDLTDKFFDCDLLIIDDLGCEMSTQFTVSVLYDLINTRLNEGLSTIISTNLSAEELHKKYDDRLTSRIFGHFIPLPFSGTDIRQQKLSE